MYIFDPFLEEQKRLAGTPNGQDKVSVNMPSLQTPKTDMSNIPTGDNVVAGILAKKASEVAQSRNQAQPSNQYDPTGKTPEQIMAETGHQSDLDQMRSDPNSPLNRPVEQQIQSQPMPQQNKPIEQVMAETGRQSELDKMGAAPIVQAPPMQEQVKPLTPEVAPGVQPITQQPLPEPTKPIQGGQSTILSQSGTLGERAGARQAADVFSGGINTGRDIRVPVGTSVAVPQGTWEVVDAFDKANRKGFIGDNTNDGYGNSVLVKNQDTGETMRFSHLDFGGVNVKNGQKIEGGTVIGRTGVTGNTSGPHLDLEYKDGKGRVRDIINDSPYGKSMFGDGKEAPPQQAAPQAVEATQSAQLNIPEQPVPFMQPPQAPEQMFNPMLDPNKMMYPYQ